MSGGYQRAIRDAVADADLSRSIPRLPLAARATDQVRRDELQRRRAPHTATGRSVKRTPLVAAEGAQGPDRRPMHHHRAAAMNFTPISTGAPHFSVDQRAVAHATAFGYALRLRAARMDSSRP
jgi:hypothetical protein